MVAYYNEFDPKAAAWLRELIRCGHIADGIVDERSIEDVTPADLAGYTQVHFFAGIGVWSYALRAAGWADDRPVWTGSCPCQPFSAAGKGGGFADERHLWPAFHYLIDQCRPDVVFGEQVASKDGLGWLDLVQADLEGTGYASGAVDLCAAGVGAPHIRQRLWWFGERLDDATGARHVGPLEQPEGHPRDEAWLRLSGAGRTADRLDDDDDDTRLEGQRGRHQTESGRVAAAGPATATGELGGLADPDGWDASAERQQPGGEQRQQPQDRRVLWLERASSERRERGQETTPGYQHDRAAPIRPEGEHGSGKPGAYRIRQHKPGPTNGLWSDADWLFCRDGKWRPVEPGTFPLAHGAPERVGRLRGYGNAIVAPAAQAFIEAYLEAAQDGGFRMTALSDLSHGVFD